MTIFKRWIGFGFFTAVLAVSASAQTDVQCATVEECNRVVAALTQALNKTLDVNKANEQLVAAQKAQIEAQERLIAVKDALNAEQSKLIQYYRDAICDRTSYLFGLIKTKRCRL